MHITISAIALDKFAGCYKVATVFHHGHSIICIIFIAHFNILIQYQGVLRTHSVGQLKITSTERRLVFTFCYYVIMGIFILVFVNVILDNWHRSIITYERYFICQYNPQLSLECGDLLMKADKYTFPVPFTIVSVMVGAIPAVNLAFVINLKWIKIKVFQFIHIIHDLKTSHALEFVS